MDLAAPAFMAVDDFTEGLAARTPHGRYRGLYVSGSLEGLSAPVVAVVGTRAPSPAGRSLARTLAYGLARRGVCILSGLALGIDAAAHEGALEARAPTIGVLGSGHRRFFPARNRELAERMVRAGGGVISPYPPDEPAFPWRFLERNGLVAALCDAVVVVEAAERSGALNTASWAAERGIPVLAVPGDVDRPKAAGCLALIRDGATLVRGAADVLAALPAGTALPGLLPEAQSGSPRDLPEVARGEPGSRLLAELLRAPATLEDLAARLALPLSSVAAALIELELEGVVEGRGAGRFAAVRS